MKLRSRLRLLTVAVILLGTTSSLARAQMDEPADSSMTPYGDRKALKHLTIGLGFQSGLSMGVEAPTNWKVNPVFAYRIGAIANYPITPVVNASLGFGIENRGSKYFWYDDKALTEFRHVDYFYLNPAFRFSAFKLGLNIGFPLGGQRYWQNSTSSTEFSEDLDADRDSLLVMIEPRIGAMIPLLDDDLGWLALSIEAGYNLSDLSEKSDFLPYDSVDKPIGTSVPTFQLGLHWLFAIPGTERE